MTVKVKLADVGRDVQNLVASLNFHVSFKLPEISRILGADYDPSNFPGAIYRKRAGYTFLLFRNGKSVLAGVKSFDQMHDAINGFKAEAKEKLGIKITNVDIEIQNLVLSLDTHVEINLEHFVHEVYDSYYSPELFPGLTFKIYDPPATFLVFSSGKCVLVGLKRLEDVDRAISKLCNTLNESGAVRGIRKDKPKDKPKGK
ncbi:MAG: TATA-box-binding protein [Candidatus Altiarchaeota archaeon]|nr:TATA-box-binding protein [Candidatus Altiarchaeota archaeon]